MHAILEKEQRKRKQRHQKNEEPSANVRKPCETPIARLFASSPPPKGSAEAT